MTRPCCKCSRCGTSFLCTNGEMENGYCSQHSLDYLFSRYLRPKNNDQKRGQKETSRTYCKHSRHLSVCGQLRKRSSAESLTASSPSQLFPGGYTGVRLSYGAVLQQISDSFKWDERGKRKKDAGLTRGVNPDSHIPHLQAHLAFAWHECSFMVFSLLPAHPSETIRRCQEVKCQHALT